MGAPHDLIQMVMNVYTNSTTQIRMGNGLTNSIPLLADVKQGCPLSAILFNLFIELILRQAKTKATTVGPAVHHGTPLSILAYADDLVVIARNRQNLQKILDSISESANILGLSFRPDKSASLSFTNSKTAPNRIESHTIPILTAKEQYRYLGVPIGVIHNCDNSVDLVQTLIEDINKIQASLLALWQEVGMIRTFIQPSLTFALRAGYTRKQTLTTLRSKLVATVKNICNLPNRATAHYMVVWVYKTPQKK